MSVRQRSNRSQVLYGIAVLQIRSSRGDPGNTPENGAFFVISDTWNIPYE